MKALPLPLALASLLALAVPGCDSGREVHAAGEDRPPNIILVSIDTLRRDHVSLYGYQRDTTPHLDRLAEECVVFEDAYCTAAWTLPSHMTMLTGLYPDQHGVNDRKAALTPSFPTLTQRLQERGYETIGLYRPGWLDPRYGFDRGFATYVSHDDAAEAEGDLHKALRRRDPFKPLFLFIHLFDVHCGNLRAPGSTMYTPPPPYDELFTSDAAEKLAGLDMARLWEKPKEGEPFPVITEEQREALIGLYDGGIRYVDDKLAEWIEELRAEGIFDDSIFIFTADHGEGLAQREARWGGHGDLNEEGLQVPLLIRYPGARWAGRRVSQRVSHVDLLPTVLDYLGAYDERLPGISLLGEISPDRLVLAQQGAEVIYQGHWKLLAHRSGAGAKLCDLEKDPEGLSLIRPGQETPEQRAIHDRLRAAIAGLRKTWFDPGRSEATEQESAAVHDELQKLGYTGE